MSPVIRERPVERQESQQLRWHALHAAETLEAVKSSKGGLTGEEVRRRLERFGPNALPEAARRSWLSVAAAQFKSPLVFLLFLAAGVAFLLGHGSDSIVIFTVVLLNAAIGVFQEGRAERSLAALRKLASQKARVVRDGSESLVEARDVVVGDILVLEAGDAVAADARLLHGAALQIAEAALTGESAPVDKDLSPVHVDTPLSDRRSMVYAGTHVTAGRARAVVVATGVATEIGHIATLAETAAQPKTPLEQRISQFGRYLIVASSAMFLLVNAVGLLHGLPFGEIVMVAISQLVGMIPEGLPVALTIALAVGVQRMARRKAVVRRLSAVETLGSTTVICSDKTGTLTKNEMTVTALCLPGGRRFVVTGAGYEPRGEFLDGERRIDPLEVPPLRELLEAALLCNDASLRGPHEAEPRWSPIGDPTEVALVTLGVKAGLAPEQVRERWPRRAEIPFDSAVKMMATQHDTEDGSRVIVKGAPEVVLKLCHSIREGGRTVVLTDAGRRAVAEVAQGLAERALRVLAVGVVERAEVDGRAGLGAFAGRVTLLGLLGQIDPPRDEAKEAVERCRQAGIRAVMVTGDHKATGRAIAQALGITRDGDLAVDGSELERMSDAELSASIDRISVFARVHPAQKLRIVQAFQHRREVVAMTGDGVNDAPALVKADVGVAMGITGTEVAKESAEIVIGDDNFATIVAAVEEGRVVYRNLKKVVLFLLSTSIAAVVVLLSALVLGYPPPLAAVQILWINLVSEGAVTVNLIMEPPEGDEMSQKPVPRSEPLVTRLLATRMAVMVPAIALSTLGWFVFRYRSGLPFAQVQTETFTVLAVCQWFNVLNCRSARRSAFNLSLLKNPWLIGGLVLGNLLQLAVVFLPALNETFHTVPFGLGQVFAIGAVASLVLWVEELRKLAARLGRRAAVGSAG